MPMSTLSAGRTKTFRLGSFDAVFYGAAHRLGVEGLALSALILDLLGQVGDVEVVVVVVVGVMGRRLVIAGGFILVSSSKSSMSEV